MFLCFLLSRLLTLFHCLSFCCCFLPKTWSVQRPKPEQTRPVHFLPPPPPPPSPFSPAGCTHQHFAVVSISIASVVLITNFTPLGLSRRPRGSPHWSFKLRLAMPQVRGGRTERQKRNDESSIYSGAITVASSRRLENVSAWLQVWKNQGSEPKCVKQYWQTYCC